MGLRRVVWLGLLAFAVGGGCSDRDLDTPQGGTGTSGGSSESGDPTATDSGTGPQFSTGPQLDCGADGTQCGKICTNLLHDDYNCGECGRGCKFTEGGVGDCVDGEYCTPGWSHCVEPWDTYANCHEACVAWGETCVEEGNGRRIQFGFDDTLGCDAHLNKSGNGSQPDAKCSDPLDFSEKGPFDEPTIGIRCLCTQNNLDYQGDV